MMDQKLKKVKDNKCDKASKDRGDLKKNLTSKLNEDFGVHELQRVRIPHDRGDSKPQVRNFPTINVEKASPTLKNKFYKEKKKIDDFSQNVLSNQIANNVKIQTDFGEISKQVANKKKIEESTVKNRDINVSTDDVDEPHDFFKTNKDLKRNLDSEQKNRLPSPQKEVKTDTPNKTYLDFAGRKQLRERYTIKLKSNQNSSRNIDSKDSAKINVKNDDNVKKQMEDKSCNPKPYELIKNNNQIDSPKSIRRQSETQNQVHRKPLIKTVRLSNDNRVYHDYKSVTFQDQKEVMPIQIKIPCKLANEKKENYISTSTNTVKTKYRPETGKISEHAKMVKKRKERHSNVAKKRAISPVTVKSFGSPQTEVARWAPSCINGHTKPYYEAWVNTTLAAITKCSEKEKRLCKQNILKTFKRALDIDEASRTPDLVYEKFNDETYTGRIKVRKNQSQPPPKKSKRKRLYF